MAAATAARNTPWELNRGKIHGPVEAATSIYLGTLVCVDSASAHPGDFVAGSTATTLTCMGIAQGTTINTTAAGFGAAGALSVSALSCIAKLGNSASTDQVTQALVGQNCYIVDNQTVAATSGSSTRSVAGKVMFIDADGSPWVLVGVL